MEHKKKNKEKTSKNFSKDEKMMVYAIIALALLLVGFYYYVYVMPTKVSTPKQISVEIIELTADCEDCFDVKAVYNQIVSDGNLLVKSTESLDYTSEEGRKLLEKYNVQNVPAFIIESKNLDDLALDPAVMTIGKDYALFDKSVPSIDTNSGELKGIVDFIEIQPEDCLECMSVGNLLSSFESLGVKVGNYEIIKEDSAIGKELIDNNKLSFAPALLISKDVADYWWSFEQIKPVLVELEDYYLFSVPLAPYIDLNSKSIKGIVSATYIENSSCTDCFNVTDLGNSFKATGTYFDQERVLDISSTEGRNIALKYNITAIPTIIMSEGIQDYPQLAQTLAQVGTFENDGSFVFRKLDATNAKYQEISL